jgi:DNA-binding NarL/FixJ family response regulator
MLTMGEDPDGVARAVSGGARGYVAKDASREEVAATVALALAAGREGPGSRSARIRPAGAPPALTEREQQVLDGMSRGKSNAEIGRELYLSEDTVKTHARRLFRKLAAADRAQAVALGFRWGFLR